MTEQNKFKTENLNEDSKKEVDMVGKKKITRKSGSSGKRKSTKEKSRKKSNVWERLSRW